MNMRTIANDLSKEGTVASIKDVALRANVSIGTASRALRNVGYISNEVREKVLKAAEELNYVANYGAQQIRMTNAVKTIGIIISESMNDYFFKVIALLNERLPSHAFRILVLYSSGEAQEESENFRYLISNRVSAILFVPASEDRQHAISLAQKYNINVVQLFVNAYGDLNTVINDDEQGAAIATQHLIAQGCKNLLLLDAPYKNFDPKTVSPNRQAGFNAHSASGLKTTVVNYDPYAPNAVAQLKSILREVAPDGVIAGIGKTGQYLATLLHAGEFAFRLVSFDDNSWFESYGISAIRQGTTQLVDAICDVLLHPEREVTCFHIPEELIVRGT